MKYVHTAINCNVLSLADQIREHVANLHRFTQKQKVREEQSNRTSQMRLWIASEGEGGQQALVLLEVWEKKDTVNVMEVTD